MERFANLFVPEGERERTKAFAVKQTWAQPRPFGRPSAPRSDVSQKCCFTIIRLWPCNGMRFAMAAVYEDDNVHANVYLNNLF